MIAQITLTLRLRDSRSKWFLQDQSKRLVLHAIVYVNIANRTPKLQREHRIQLSFKEPPAALFMSKYSSAVGDDKEAP